jgi:hypothetical protein
MRARSSATLLIVAGSFALGCATPSRALRIETCLTDPVRNVMHCDGVTKAWEIMADYVCHPLSDHETFVEGYR